jgi:hypothetical protein
VVRISKVSVTYAFLRLQFALRPDHEAGTPGYTASIVLPLDRALTKKKRARKSHQQLEPATTDFCLSTDCINKLYCNAGINFFLTTVYATRAHAPKRTTRAMATRPQAAH